MISQLKKLRMSFSKLFGIISGLIGAILFALTMTQIFSRLVAEDIDWIFESSRILLLMSVATGAFVASLQNDHFRVVLGGNQLSGIERPSLMEVLRQAVIIACLGLLFIVGIPTIARTRMHPLTTLPGDYSIFRIIYLSGIGGMLLAHLCSLFEIVLRLLAGKSTTVESIKNED